MAGDDDDDERIRQAVRALLATGDLDELSELKVYTLVEASMGLALTETQRRMVRTLAHDHIFNGRGAEGTCASVKTEPAGAEDEHEDKGANGIAPDRKRKPPAATKSASMTKRRTFPKLEGGGDILCELSPRRFVTLSEWKGQQLVSVREYYEKNGKLHPASKGISLTLEQWDVFCEAFDSIKTAVDCARK
eukprot:SM000143S00759  [mRNA]  locus=s143:358483:359610:- [translate_table: standard]